MHLQGPERIASRRRSASQLEKSPFLAARAAQPALWNWQVLIHSAGMHQGGFTCPYLTYPRGMFMLKMCFQETGRPVQNKLSPRSRQSPPPHIFILSADTRPESERKTLQYNTIIDWTESTFVCKQACFSLLHHPPSSKIFSLTK